MSHKLDHPNKAQIIAAIQAKEKWDWIQAAYKCGIGTICRYRKQLALAKQDNKPKIERNEEIKRLRKEKPLKELAAMYGVSVARISQLALR